MLTALPHFKALRQVQGDARVRRLSYEPSIFQRLRSVEIRQETDANTSDELRLDHMSFWHNTTGIDLDVFYIAADGPRRSPSWKSGAAQSA